MPTLIPRDDALQRIRTEGVYVAEPQEWRALWGAYRARWLELGGPPERR